MFWLFRERFAIAFLENLNLFNSPCAWVAAAPAILTGILLTRDKREHRLEHDAIS